MQETTHSQSYASYKRKITTLKYMEMNWDRSEKAYKCERRIKEKHINSDLIYLTETNK